jgi:hypothetical protein
MTSSESWDVVSTTSTSVATSVVSFSGVRQCDLSPSPFTMLIIRLAAGSHHCRNRHTDDYARLRNNCHHHQPYHLVGDPATSLGRQRHISSGTDNHCSDPNSDDGNHLAGLIGHIYHHEVFHIDASCHRDEDAELSRLVVIKLHGHFAVELAPTFIDHCGRRQVESLLKPECLNICRTDNQKICGGKEANKLPSCNYPRYAKCLGCYVDSKSVTIFTCPRFRMPGLLLSCQCQCILATRTG